MKLKLYERVYDAPLDESGKEKPNKFIGEFDTDIDEQPVGENGLPNDYSYIIYGVKDGSIYKIIGEEVSYKDGGTKHYVQDLFDTEEVKMYIKFINSKYFKNSIHTT